MTKGLKALVGVVLVFSLLLSGVGYASLTDTLSVTGTASAEAAKEVYIYDVQFTENNLGTFENITYPSGTVLMADSVTFDANGRASIFVYVRNNSASDMMYYGINTSPAENPGYTALLLDPDSVETGNELDKDGTAYVVGVRGDKDNRTNAVTGAIINKNSTHDGLLLGLTGEPNMTVNDVVLSLHYDEILDDQYWRGYTVSFMEAVTTDGNTTAVATEVTGLDDTRPENVEPLDGNTAMLVTSVTEQGASKGELSLSTFSPTSATSTKVFKGWVNSLGNSVTKIDANNTSNFTLYATWENRYTIYIFADDGSLLYSEIFTPSDSARLSDNAEAAMNSHLSEINTDDMVNNKHLIASYPTCDLSQAQDVYLRPEWKYNGVASLEPQDFNNDGVIDEFYIVGITNMDSVDVVIPSEVNGVPVTSVGDKAFDQFDDLTNVYIPLTITTLGEDAFADQNDPISDWLPIQREHRETIQFYYEGTKAQWDAISKHDNWDHWLGTNSLIVCSDGMLRVTSISSGQPVWTFYAKDLFTSSNSATEWSTFDEWSEFKDFDWGNLDMP